MGNIDTTKLVNFVLHWLFAGFWAALGFTLYMRFLNPVLPWPS